jgi:hypothetical protein
MLSASVAFVQKMIRSGLSAFSSRANANRVRKIISLVRIAI